MRNYVVTTRYCLMLFLIISCNNETSVQQKSQVVNDSKKSESLPAPANPIAGFRHAYATVNGVKIHYVVGGSGDPLVLLHDFGQNWFMWNRMLPELSKHFTVVAPDLRGMGESDRPDNG